VSFFYGSVLLCDMFWSSIHSFIHTCMWVLSCSVLQKGFSIVRSLHKFLCLEGVSIDENDVIWF